jgi:hypothetical protein
MDLSKTLQQEINAVLKSEPKGRIPLILDSPRTKEIIEALPVHDAYFMIKESWGEDSQILLQYMSEEKIQNLIDIDCWDKDVPSIKHLIEWFKELMEASVSTFANAINALDIELTVLMFQSFIEVRLISPTDENIIVLTEAGFETFDNLYFFRYLDEREENQTIRIFLDTVFTHNQELYHLIMQNIPTEMSSSLEEKAFEQRLMRLLEMGFTPPSDSLSIYRHIKPETLVSKEAHDSKKLYIEENNRVPALYEDQFKKGGSLIIAALQEVDEDLQQRLQWEMVYLTNKIIMADYVPLGDLEHIEYSIEKAKGLVSIGLGFLKREKKITLASIFDKFDAETLFCLGYNLVMSQQKRLKDIIRANGISIIPERERSLFDDILKKKPLYQGKEFSSIEELDIITHAIDQMEAMSLLFAHFGWEKYLEELPLTNVQSRQGLDMENIILTAVAVNLIEKKTFFRPLTIKEAATFIHEIVQKDPKGEWEIRPQFCEGLCNLLKNIEPLVKTHLIQEIAENIEKRLISEVSGIKNIQSIDPRFITCLAVKIQNQA